MNKPVLPPIGETVSYYKGNGRIPLEKILAARSQRRLSIHTP